MLGPALARQPSDPSARRSAAPGPSRGRLGPTLARSISPTGRRIPSLGGGSRRKVAATPCPGPAGAIVRKVAAVRREEGAGALRKVMPPPFAPACATRTSAFAKGAERTSARVRAGTSGRDRANELMIGSEKPVAQFERDRGGYRATRSSARATRARERATRSGPVGSCSAFRADRGGYRATRSSERAKRSSERAQGGGE